MTEKNEARLQTLIPLEKARLNKHFMSKRKSWLFELIRRVSAKQIDLQDTQASHHKGVEVIIFFTIKHFGD